MKQRRAQDRVYRAVPLALLWIVLQSAVAGYMHGNSIGQMIANHLPMSAVLFLVLLVVAVNPLIARFAPRQRYTTVEVAVAWTMVTVASCVPGYGMMEFLFPYLTAPSYFASSENQWAEIVLPHLKKWLYVSEFDAARDFYDGVRSGEPIPWEAWTKPAAFWIAWSLAFFGAILCWSVVVRKQWVERERYAFPLVHVARLVTEVNPTGSPFSETLRSPLMWAAFGSMVVLHGIKGLHLYVPVVPDIPIDFPIDRFFTSKPWNMLVQSWPLWFHVYFSVIGVAYFLQLDVAMSLWFFFIVYKLQEVFFSAYSITHVGTQQQVMGAVVVIGLSLLWNGRRHFADAWRTAWNRRAGASDDDEPMSYRAAVFGALGAVGILAVLTLAMGASLWMTFAFLALLGLMATVVGWHVSNAGLLLVNVGFSPYEFFTTVLGSRVVGARNLVLLGFDRSSIPHWSSESLMPYALQSFRLFDMRGVNPRVLRLPLLMAFGILVAVVVSYVASLQFIYRQGAVNLEPWVYAGVGRMGLNLAGAAIQNPYPPNVEGVFSVAIGGAVTAGLLAMRHRFLWWPLHPLGYALGITWAPFHLWFSTLLGWALKLVVLRLGGLGLYRRSMPLFLGLILGEYTMVAALNLVGLFTRVSYWGLPH